MWLKLLLNVGATVAFIYVSKLECSFINSFQSELKWNYLDYDSQLGHVYYILTVSILLHVIDRQIEYIFRLEFQWRTRIDVEKKEAQIMGDINRILLENILPRHVAHRFLYSSFSNDQRLYHESYDFIAVMFASIPNYSQFYTETVVNEEGVNSLLLLNEIICDFDKVRKDSNLVNNKEYTECSCDFLCCSFFWRPTFLKLKKLKQLEVHIWLPLDFSLDEDQLMYVYSFKTKNEPKIFKFFPSAS